MKTYGLTIFVLALVVPVGAQWQLQESHTTASLRGIHSVGNGVAWASGSEGTVLRTVDGGKNWVKCAVPEGGERLDFRGVQGFDAKTAMVMSSGKGDLSRLYKTVDGCGSWQLASTNPDKDGFWDSVKVENDEHAFILGDSVAGELRVWEWKEGWEERELELSSHARGSVELGEGSFAASNSVLQLATTPQVDAKWKYLLRFASELNGVTYMNLIRDESGTTCEPCREEVVRVKTPMSGNTSSAGIFSFDFRTDLIGVAVGGDYSKPNDRHQTSASSFDGGQTWSTPVKLPNGYRSAVAYDSAHKTWITVGPNGTDVSTDDGRNWRALKPGPDGAADEDQHWNALSLPFVVGAKGRIGVLRDEALSGKQAVDSSTKTRQSSNVGVMELYLATTNAGKLRDFAHALTPGYTITPLLGMDAVPVPEETADSFEGNARIKAVAYSLAAPGKMVLADDSGLEVDALGGGPGVRSARYAEDRGFTTNRPLPADQRNNLCLLDALASTREEARTGRYRCVLALAKDGEVVATASGTVEGEILAVPRGTQGFGYDPLFLLSEEGLTMAEISMEMRQRYSHRARALGGLLERLKG